MKPTLWTRIARVMKPTLWSLWRLNQKMCLWSPQNTLRLKPRKTRKITLWVWRNMRKSPQRQRKSLKPALPVLPQEHQGGDHQKSSCQPSNLLVAKWASLSKTIDLLPFGRQITRNSKERWHKKGSAGPLQNREVGEMPCSWSITTAG